MTPGVAGDPERSERTGPPASVDTTAAAWARAFFSHPSRVAVALEVIGACAIASVLPLRHWPSSALVASSPPSPWPSPWPVYGS